MATIKISDLPLATALDGTESVPLVQAGTTKRAAAALLGCGATASSTSTFVQTVINPVYYVRADGSDTNTGLANTAAGAWLTLQHAANIICGTLRKGQNDTYVNLVIGNGTFSGAQFFGALPGAIAISGQGTTTIIDCDVTGAGFYAVGSGSVYVSDLKTISTGGGKHFFADLNAWMFVQGGITCNATLGDYIFFVEDNGEMHVIGTVTINVTTGCAAIVYGSNDARISWFTTPTITGNPAFSEACAVALGCTIIDSPGGTSGAATGLRFRVSTNSMIDGNGDGPYIFSGDTTGIVETGGGYF